MRYGCITRCRVACEDEVQYRKPEGVLITGGHQLGGVGSFAQGLREGFLDLGIQAQVVSPKDMACRFRDLRNPRILKILSTTGVFASPVARRAICVAHGIPCIAYQGLLRASLITSSFHLANRCLGSQLIAVSEYTASHLEAVFGVCVDAVILNPVKRIYQDVDFNASQRRDYITYLGRLTPSKGLVRLLPVIRDLLGEVPSMRMCIIGEGPEKAALIKAVDGDARFEFLGNLDDITTREYLRQTKVFVSGNKVEGLGITYIEALSQGCAIAMPAGGGGVEVALDQVGTQVHLLPLSLEHGQTLSVLRRALHSDIHFVPATAYTPSRVAKAYLDIDARFDANGRFCRTR